MTGRELKDWVLDLEPDDEVVPVIDTGHDDGIDRVVLWVKDTPATPATWLNLGCADIENKDLDDLSCW